jgi:hypothetical protein
MPSCPKSRACSQKNCLLPGPAAVFRQRVARAEYESVGDPATLISEQRIADVWNQYGREIGAPGETIITVAAIHNMRDGVYTVAQPMRVRGNQTIWTMPDVYALGPDGKVADACRAIETVRVIHDLDDLFQSLRGARDRLRKGFCAVREDQEAGGGPKRAATQHHPAGSACRPPR